MSTVPRVANLGRPRPLAPFYRKEGVMGKGLQYFGGKLLWAGMMAQVLPLFLDSYESSVLRTAGACVALAGLLMFSIGFVLVMRNGS